MKGFSIGMSQGNDLTMSLLEMDWACYQYDERSHLAWGGSGKYKVRMNVHKNSFEVCYCDHNWIHDPDALSFDNLIQYIPKTVHMIHIFNETPLLHIGEYITWISYSLLK